MQIFVIILIAIIAIIILCCIKETYENFNCSGDCKKITSRNECLDCDNCVLCIDKKGKNKGKCLRGNNYGPISDKDVCDKWIHKNEYIEPPILINNPYYHSYRSYYDPYYGYDRMRHENLGYRNRYRSGWGKRIRHRYGGRHNFRTGSGKRGGHSFYGKRSRR
jgi:hypothetical protein